MFHRLRQGHVADTDGALGQAGRQGRAAGMIGLDHAQQLENAGGGQAHRQAAHGSRGGIAPDARRHQVMLDNRDHLIHDGAFDSDALQKRAGHGTARGFMTPTRPARLSIPIPKLGSGRLGEIVAQGGEQHHGAIVACQVLTLSNVPGRIHHQHGVRADVAFRMPPRVLRNAGQRADFREMDHPAGCGQILGDPAGMAAAGPFHELFGDALPRQGSRTLRRHTLQQWPGTAPPWTGPRSDRSGRQTASRAARARDLR